MKFLNETPIRVNFPNTISNELFETIKIKNGYVYNLEYHQRRINFAFSKYYKIKNNLFLKDILTNIPQKGLFRAKIVYNQSGLLDINLYPYKKKEIKEIIIVESNINYNFKYLNRDFFNYLHKTFKADEFLIVQNGYVREFTIGNIALFANNSWFSPKNPLLFGTTLNRYLEKKEIILKNIHYKDLKKYSKIALLNAMVDFNIIKE